MMESDAKTLGLSRPSLTENVHWVVGAFVLLYVVFSECAGVYLLGPPAPGQDRVASRFIEGVILWGLVYSIVSMCSVALKRPIMSRRVVLWGTLAPILVGFVVVGWVWWGNGFAMQQSLPRGFLGIYLRLLPAFPAAAGLAVGTLVWFEAGVARRVLERHTTRLCPG